MRKEIMKITHFRVEDIFGDIINKENISQNQIIKPRIFHRKKCKYLFWYNDKFI